MPTWAQCARDFRRSLRGPKRDTIKALGGTNAQRLFFALSNSIRTDGTLIPPNTRLTLKIKAKQGFDLRPGVRRRKLLQGLHNAVRFIDDGHVQVLGSDGRRDNDFKANILIKGRGATTITKKIRGRERDVPIPAQVPRDYVGIDPKVLDVNVAFAQEAVLARLRWPGATVAGILGSGSV